MSKTTASIPKSRSKYLIQFLKHKMEAGREDPALSPDHFMSEYDNTEEGSHRRGMSSQVPITKTKMDEQGYNYQERVRYEEDKEARFQTPKNYSTRRRIKKISLESTKCTSGGTIIQKSRFQRKRDCKKLNNSHERLKQVDISDQSIEEVDEEEDPLEVPSLR